MKYEGSMTPTNFPNANGVRALSYTDVDTSECRPEPPTKMVEILENNNKRLAEVFDILSNIELRITPDQMVGKDVGNYAVDTLYGKIRLQEDMIDNIAAMARYISDIL